MVVKWTSQVQLRAKPPSGYIDLHKIKLGGTIASKKLYACYVKS